MELATCFPSGSTRRRKSSTSLCVPRQPTADPFCRGGRVQPRRQPAKDAARQSRRKTQADADVPDRQPPDVRQPPRLPEFLDWFRRRAQIIDPFDQQYIFLGDSWLAQGQVQRRLIQRVIRRTQSRQRRPYRSEERRVGKECRSRWWAESIKE